MAAASGSFNCATEVAFDLRLSGLARIVEQANALGGRGMRAQIARHAEAFALFVRGFALRVALLLSRTQNWLARDNFL